MKKFIRFFAAALLLFTTTSVFSEDIQNWSKENVNFFKKDNFNWNLTITSFKNKKSKMNLPQKGKVTLWKGKECLVYPELQPKNHEKYNGKTQVFKKLKCKNAKKKGKESINYLITMCDKKEKKKKIVMSMGKPNTPTSVYIDCN